MIFKALQKQRPANLSLNLSAQTWQALAQIGQQLQNLAAAQMGERDFVARPQPHTVCELVNEFLLTKARAGRSDRYLRALRNSLAKLAHGRMNISAGRVTVQEVEAWLNNSGWAARTQKGYLGDVRTMFNFGVRRSLVSHNPTIGVELPVAVTGPVTIHSPGEVKTVLEFARSYNADICRALAVRYFAGLRSAEVALLNESQIRQVSGNDSANGFIEVTATNAKTRRRRLVTIQPCLASWLALGGRLPVVGCQSNVWRDFTAALKRVAGVPWHHNVTRHSFVSYHLAQWQNAGKAALEAGHSEQMLFAHYREIVTPPNAAAFWAIVPVQSPVLLPGCVPGDVSDYTLPPANTLIVGMTGSGKTTFVNRLLINSNPACRFIFDDLDRMTARLKLKPLYFERELEAALSLRWASFHPVRAFPGDTKNAFRWFYYWIYEVAKRGPGEKMVSVPEVWRHCTADSMPAEFALLIQAGRELNLHVIVDTQRPEMLNPSITGSATELVCFKLISPEALRVVEKLGMNRQQVAALPLGSFIARNQLSGGTLVGKVF